jgi:hypothetical protein
MQNQTQEAVSQAKCLLFVSLSEFKNCTNVQQHQAALEQGQLAPLLIGK